ncbi:MAG: hypothetical protein HQL31_01135 [Planctomycetes bacterium]|nr:hypothetical protein [Planctomycetota bacterium]
MKRHLLVALAALLPFVIPCADLEAFVVGGNLSYEKVVYKRGGTSGYTAQAPLSGALIRVLQSTGAGDSLFTRETDSSGSFSIDSELDLNGQTSFDLQVEARTVAEINSRPSVACGSGADFPDGEPAFISGVYTHSLGSFAAAQTLALTISKNEDSGAFNIFSQLQRGRDFILAKLAGNSYSHAIQAVWPASSTQFDPDNFLMGIQSRFSDPDEFDDDIILHEFGHLTVEEFSVDDSEGGLHSITDLVDLRLSWSEGLATFISCAIRNDPLNIDSLGDEPDSPSSLTYSLAAPSAEGVGTENEWAVGYVLWQAFQDSGGGSEVFQSLVRFKGLNLMVGGIPVTAESEQITMDTFHDVWADVAPAYDLGVYYLDRAMSYQEDSLSASSAALPTVISSLAAPYVVSALTFYSHGDKDYFSFAATAGKSYEIETALCKNGALTKINLYKGSVSPSFLVASNAQRFELATDDTSYIFYTASETGNLIAEVERFASSSKNYGLDVSTYQTSSYTKTAGRYGSYSFAVNEATGGSADPTHTNIQGDSFTVPTTSDFFSSVVGGGGGGCFIR